MKLKGKDLGRNGKTHVVWLGSKSLWELRISDDQNRKKTSHFLSRLKDLKDWVGNQDRVKTCFQVSKIVTRTSIGWIHSTHTYLPSTILLVRLHQWETVSTQPPHRIRLIILWGFSKWRTRNSIKFLCFCFTFHIANDFSTQFWIYIKHPHNFQQISTWVSELSILINSCNLVICLCFSPHRWHFSNERVETRFLNLNKNDGKKNRLVNWDRTYQETGLKIRIN